MTRRIVSAIAGSAMILVATVGLISASPAAAGEYVVTFNANANTYPGCTVWFVTGMTTFGYNPPCGGSPLGFYGGGPAGSKPAGARIGMQTNAPPGVSITSAFVSPWEIYNLNDDQGWGGGSYYSGGGSVWKGSDTYEQDPSFLSPYWGFQMVCGRSTCKNFGGIYLNSIQLTATENRGPALTAIGTHNLWYQAGHWIWNPAGDPWQFDLNGNDPSGVCQMWATINGTRINSPAQTPDTSVWQQCPDWTWAGQGATVDTREHVPGRGELTLTLAGSNAAGVTSAPSETLKVDNQPVELAVSGPSVAATTAGTQYITATASAGPSGVAIGCSVDGSQMRWHNTRTVRVPVSGASEHHITCQAHNGAVDPQDQYAYSPRETRSLNIGQPTISEVGFQKLVDKLQCRRRRERVIVPARRATIRQHHKRVAERTLPHTTTVDRCHVRVVWRREAVLVKIRRHGKLITVKRTKRVRVPLVPHTVLMAKERVPFGDGTTVSGWLGTASGVAIANAPVAIRTAPNDGVDRFQTAASATTATNGNWSVKIGSGPSRIVQAVYPGGPGLMPSTSTPAQLNVPARITLTASPRTLPWSGVVTLRGQLKGGYVPRDGIALRLLIDLPHRARPYEPVPFRTDANGDFAIHWSWGTGSGVASYPFAVATTATESDYPFSANRSPWRRVTFGLRTPHKKTNGSHHRRPQSQRR